MTYEAIPLREYVDERFVVLSDRMDRRTTDIENAARGLAERVRETAEFHAAAHDREHKAHEREHVLSEAALVKSDLTLDKRLDSANAFRQQLQDQNATFVSKDTIEQLKSSRDARSDGIERDVGAIRLAMTGLIPRVEFDTLRENREQQVTVLIAARISREDQMQKDIDLLRGQNERMQGILSLVRFLGVGGVAIAVAALVLAFTGHPMT